MHSVLSNNQMIKKKGDVQLTAIWLPVLYLLSFIVCSDAVRFSFGMDLSFLFVLGIIFFYFAFYKNHISKASFYGWWIYLLIVPTLIMCLMKDGDMGHMIHCTLIMILPIVLEPFIPHDDKTISFGLYFVVGVSLLLLFLYANFGFLGNWNTNCMGYLLFLGFAALTVLLSKNRKNVWLWVFYAYAFVQLLVTGSRNISIAVIITALLVLLKGPISKKWVYRVVYTFAILYPLIFPWIATEMVGTALYEWLAEITETIYDKGQGGVFSGRPKLYLEAEKLIGESWVHYLFGYGKTMVSFYAAHNGYYVLHYTYGLIGTLVIVGALIYFFEKTFILINAGDSISYGCFAIMISVLFQQASEGWFLGTYLITLMPFVYMAIVIKRYRIYIQKRKNENGKEKDE